jgi:heterodisulfide reductase subunit C
LKEFGYHINRDRQIDFDRRDRKLTEYLFSLEPSIRTCFDCGTCTATCTAGQLTDFNIRRIQTLIRRGEFLRVMGLCGKCLLCGKCQLICPRGVNLRNLILAINKITQSPKYDL